MRIVKGYITLYCLAKIYSKIEYIFAKHTDSIERFLVVTLYFLILFTLGLFWDITYPHQTNKGVLND